MHFFVTYNKKTGDITGHFKASTAEFLPEPQTPEQGILEVTERNQIESIASIDPWRHRIEGKVKESKIEDLRIQPRFQGKIVLSTDAEDRDGDGLPELPADGSTSTKVRASIYDPRERLVTEKPVKVKFRVSRGTISRREVQTEDGVADVEFTSAAETTQSRIIATATALESDAMLFEFIPVEEFQRLVKGGKK